MNAPFAIAAGSVAGRHHAHAGRNNQDAWAWTRSDAGVVAVVCDGCSSAPRSEVGAALGARLLVQALQAELVAKVDPLEAHERAHRRVLGHLASLAEAMSGAPLGTEAFAATVAEHFLFTVVGFALGREGGWAFAVGDGALNVDGTLTVLGPFPDNAPPYLAYALLGGLPPPALELRPLDVDRLGCIVAATDGAASLDFAPLRDDPRVLTNPDMARRLVWQQARACGFDDDATVVVARRTTEGGAS